ncbi:MAG: DUF2577 domain-containing protein [Butyricicoccus sp.]
MNDSFLVLIKKIALDAVRASKPCDWMTGTVKSLSPLVVSVGQKMELEEEFLSVTRTAHYSMKVGSGVLLLRKSGGQRFVIVDVLDWEQE